MARPKGKTQGQSPKRCAYQHGAEKCYKWVVGNGDFCSQHAVALPAAEAAEVNALGAETAAALREELGVPNLKTTSWGGELKVPMTEEVKNEEQRPEKEALPAAAVRNPVGYAMQMALDAVAQAYAEDMEYRSNARNPGMRMSAVDRARVKLAEYTPEMADGSAMVARNSKNEIVNLVRPGWIGRWVRDKDEDGRPNSRRVRMFLAMGCEEVNDLDGRPLVGRLGKAIQMPPQVYAARVLEKSQPGAFDSNPYVQNAIDEGEALNRRFGRKIVDIRPTADNRSYRGAE